MTAAENFEHNFTVGDNADRAPYVHRGKIVGPDERFMSDGEVIKAVDVLSYEGDSKMSEADLARRKALDGLVLSSAAGIALGAIAIVARHSKKNN